MNPSIKGPAPHPMLPPISSPRIPKPAIAPVLHTLPPPPPNKVSELAQVIAAGVLMKQSQVRTMGANAAAEQSDRTIVVINLVPVGESFDGTTALLIYQKFWHKKVVIKPNFFGTKYDVLYVRYPGLPPSPPMSPVEDGPLITGGHGRAIKPLGVDVETKGRKN